MRAIVRSVLVALVVSAALLAAPARALALPLDFATTDGDDRSVVVHGSLHGHAIVPADRQLAKIRDMSTRELRRFLRDRGAACDGCVEKHHLMERAAAVRAWPTADDYVVAELAGTSAAAATHLALQHVGDVPAEVPAGTVVLLEAPREPTVDYIVGDALCNPRLLNGTQFCHSISGMQDHARKAMAM